MAMKESVKYRGYPIEDLRKSNFIETAYLLLNDKLPNFKELEDFSTIFPSNYNVDSKACKLLMFLIR